MLDTFVLNNYVPFITCIINFSFLFKYRKPHLITTISIWNKNINASYMEITLFKKNVNAEAEISGLAIGMSIFNNLRWQLIADHNERPNRVQ